GDQEQRGLGHGGPGLDVSLDPAARLNELLEMLAVDLLRGAVHRPGRGGCRAATRSTAAAEQTHRDVLLVVSRPRDGLSSPVAYAGDRIRSPASHEQGTSIRKRRACETARAGRGRAETAWNPNWRG